MYDKLSLELKEARTRSGISLQQLASKTRIDLRFLESMEDGNFSFLPDLYVKSFLKEYIRVIGLDENLILKKYEAAKLGKEYVEPPQESFTDKIKEIKEARIEKELTKHPKPIVTFTNPPAEESNPSAQELLNKRNLLILGSAALVLIIFFLVYFLFIKKSPDIIVDEKPVDELIQESKQRYIEDEPKKMVEDTSNKSTTVNDSLRLSITASDTCWVKAVVDTVKQDEFRLYPHTSRTISAGSNFRIRVGNAYKIQLQLNNKPLNFEPKSKVSTFKVDASGLKFLELPPKQK
jgi:transcriptional regulator with XRE-family HTH domain